MYDFWHVQYLGHSKKKILIFEENTSLPNLPDKISFEEGGGLGRTRSPHFLDIPNI